MRRCRAGSSEDELANGQHSTDAAMVDLETSLRTMMQNMMLLGSQQQQQQQTQASMSIEDRKQYIDNVLMTKVRLPVGDVVCKWQSLFW
jgi:nitrogen fixation/metabolism regulation signal transduction histidine kinase